ncbi:MAG: Coenzyme F420 hydrogenase/dehydrogenase, beta subunit C-terminal domain [Bacteroidales bacterium]|nr:Coenzyme F420 hydrogenase/dehydrogenase, beta subunit C-terminal domain [Bacteroidales bacterium]
MSIHTNDYNCSGCTACASVCPKNAISMLPDALGFLYPKVDKGRCIECGLCEKVCSFNNDYDRSYNFDSPIIYAVRHQDINEIERSRSGAAFIAFSDYILKHGGVVYGAGYEGHFRVVHKRAVNKTERDEFRGSKYVQSDLNGIYKNVKVDLQAGYKVLFSGTPCQTAGLRAYIGEKLLDNLFLIDIVCHGVPSPYVWRDYLSNIERKLGEPVMSLSFRDKKKYGWKAHYESFNGQNKSISTDSYKYLFYKHIMLRKSCSICPFTNLNRPSDVTLGDYWGWQKTDKEFNKDDKGCSLLLLNTKKGVDWFDIVKNTLNFIPVKRENCLQPALQKPFPMHPHRNLFEKIYKCSGFKVTLLLWGNIGILYRLKTLINKLRRRLS